MFTPFMACAALMLFCTGEWLPRYVDIINQVFLTKGSRIDPTPYFINLVHEITHPEVKKQNQSPWQCMQSVIGPDVRGLRYAGNPHDEVQKRTSSLIIVRGAVSVPVPMWCRSIYCPSFPTTTKNINSVFLQLFEHKSLPRVFSLHFLLLS